jgi:hypothetical protein
LDLVLLGELGDEDWRLTGELAMEADTNYVTVLTEDQIFEAMKASMIGGGKAVDDVPRRIAPLPPAAVAVERALFSMNLLVSEFGDAAEDVKAVSEDSPAFKVVKRSTTRMMLRKCQRRMNTALKRLAVYLDEGRSAWLDDPYDRDALVRLLDRLGKIDTIGKKAEAEECVLPQETARTILKLHDIDADPELVFSLDNEELEKEMKGAVSVWAERLAQPNVSEPTSTGP